MERISLINNWWTEKVSHSKTIDYNMGVGKQQVAGNLSLYDRPDGWMMVSLVKVERRYRRRGIATALMYAAIQDYGHRNMRLVVSAFDNGLSAGGLIGFYAKFGFVLDEKDDTLMVRGAT